ncbi:chitinase 1 precursor [Xylariales sp. AK1849]|nr:chitinase 1 precursor [Xylariales sp. AK1849]
MECEDSGTTTSQAATGAGTSSIAADTSSVTSFRTSYLLQTDEPTTSTASTSVVLSAPTAVSSLEPIPTGPPGSFNGYKNAVYFTNWGTYGSNYQPQDLPVSELTHVLYAFADIDSDGTVKSSDTYADLEKHYPTDSWQDEGHNAYGVVKQLFLHKKNNRNLKTLLSIGGWTYSPKFAPVAASEAGRQTFASSATKLMVDYGFDGVDIDWEYPSTAVEAQDFVLLLQAVRTALDDYSAQYSLGYRFLITVATPAGPMNYDMMDLAGMDKYADAWNLMAYDYAGSRDSTTGHQSNLFKNDELPASTKYSTEDAVQYYESQGIASTKIVLGIPLYGRSFEATLGLGAPYNGVGTGGSQPGIWLYNSLPRQGAVENWDDVAKASWSYDSGTEELISYDTIKSSTVKAEYVLSRSLGGAFFWEASGDRSGDQSLINTVSQSLRWLDQTPNNLRYPTSQYDNIREGLL